MNLGDLVEVLDDLLASTSRGQASVGYLTKLARQCPGRVDPAVTDEEVQAACVVAVEKGYMEWDTPKDVDPAMPWGRLRPLASTDGTAFLRTTRTEPAAVTIVEEPGR